MTKDQIYWNRVTKAMHKVSGIDVSLHTAGRSTKNFSYCRGCVMKVLNKYYEVSNSSMAQLAGTDQGSVSYNISKHDERYSKERYYKVVYDCLIDELFSVQDSDRYNMVNDLIKQL